MVSFNAAETSAHQTCWLTAVLSRWRPDTAPIFILQTSPVMEGSCTDFSDFRWAQPGGGSLGMLSCTQNEMERTQRMLTIPEQLYLLPPKPAQGFTYWMEKVTVMHPAWFSQVPRAVSAACAGAGGLQRSLATCTSSLSIPPQYHGTSCTTNCIHYSPLHWQGASWGGILCSPRPILHRSKRIFGKSSIWTMSVLHGYFWRLSLCCLSYFSRRLLPDGCTWLWCYWELNEDLMQKPLKKVHVCSLPKKQLFASWTQVLKINLDFSQHIRA